MKATIDDTAGVLISPDAVEQLVRDFGSDDFIDAIQVFRAVRYLGNRMNETITAWLAPHEVTAAQYNYLAVLYLHDRERGLCVGELANYLHATSGTVTSMTDTLERRRLIARAQHPTDGRSVLIKLTPKGQSLYIRAARAHHECAARALAGLTAADKASLCALLARTGSLLQTKVMT